MSDRRPVFDAEFAEAIEAGGHALIGLGDNKRGLLLLVKALEWHEIGQPVFAELTERETRGADGSEWPPRPRSVSFACSADDIDESGGGLAEVVELSTYSKRVPCA